MNALTSLLVATTLSLTAVAACSGASAPDEGDESAVSQQALTEAGGTTSLVFLGSSSFLRQCAGPTHTLGCGRPLSSVPDSTPYFSAPRTWPHSTCDQFFTFRLGSHCVEAQRLEISDSHGLMEGNPGLFDGLGLSHSDGTQCRGAGQGNGVRVTPGRHCGESAPSTTSGAKSADDGKAASTADGSGTGKGGSTPDDGTGTGTGKGGSTADDAGTGKGGDGTPSK